jgi:hypothetical protein
LQVLDKKEKREDGVKDLASAKKAGEEEKKGVDVQKAAISEDRITTSWKLVRVSNSLYYPKAEPVRSPLLVHLRQNGGLSARPFGSVPCLLYSGDSSSSLTCHSKILLSSLSP